MAKSFTFNNITSQSKYLICGAIDHIVFGTKSYESIKVPGRTGNLIIDEGSYEYTPVTIIAYLDVTDCTELQRKTKVDDIRNWLFGCSVATLLFDDGIKYKAICKNIKPSHIVQNYLQLTIEFEVTEVIN